MDPGLVGIPPCVMVDKLSALLTLVRWLWLVSTCPLCVGDWANKMMGFRRFVTFSPCRLREAGLRSKLLPLSGRVENRATHPKQNRGLVLVGKVDSSGKTA